MNKQSFVKKIISQLESNLELQLKAAREAHVAATHEEAVAEDKYDTRGLEASYIAQGQANRAQEIALALEAYRTLELRPFSEDDPIRLTALVRLESEEAGERTVFLGPEAGGLKVEEGGEILVVITPASPLGRELLGKETGDLVTVPGRGVREYEILSVE